uniref:Peptidase S1 domain-containing protein n=1 Tax=Varanus komodoensis TaxID=61221 RepID=A0A8D2IMF4_VARKO
KVLGTAISAQAASSDRTALSLFCSGLTCGRQKPILVLRVAGGKNVRRGEWPWQVSLQYKGRHICSGTLIDERWILTAAHCFFKKRICPEDCQVVLGQVKLTAEMRTGVDRKISKVILHEGYKEGSVQSDIALAHLDKPVSYSGDISPICLPYSDHQFAFGTQCWLSGWGNIASDGEWEEKGREPPSGLPGGTWMRWSLDLLPKGPS